jgi:hypothetical protein
MCYAHRHTHRGQHQHKAGEVMYVAVHAIVWPIIAQNTAEVVRVSKGVPWRKTGNHTRAHRLYFLVVRAGQRGMNNEIHVVPGAIDMP